MAGPKTIPADFLAPAGEPEYDSEPYSFEQMVSQPAPAKRHIPNPFKQYEYISASELVGLTFTLRDLGIVHTSFGDTFKSTVVMPGTGELRCLMLSARNREDMVQWWLDNGMPDIEHLTIKTKPSKFGKDFYVLTQQD